MANKNTKNTAKRNDMTNTDAGRKTGANWTLITVLGVIALLIIWFVASYNGLIGSKTKVDQSWGDVEAQYQRRADLIPNLVEVAKKSSSFQQETFSEIARLRSQWQEAASSGDRAAQEAIGQQMQSALSRLLVVVENYPDLDLETFNALQAELAGTENRVNVARVRYNEAVQSYNYKVMRIPTSLIAGMFGFEKEAFFEADEGTAAAPRVTF